MNPLDVHNLLVKGWSRYARPGIYNVEGFDTPVEVVEVYTQKGDYYDDYGEYPQGWTGESWIIFQIAGKFYKKAGTVDSYGEENWDGTFTVVTPTTKEVTTYE